RVELPFVLAGQQVRGRPAHLCAQVLRRIGEASRVDEVVQGGGDRGRGAEVHLGDERADRPVRAGPLGGPARAQLLDRDRVQPGGQLAAVPRRGHGTRWVQASVANLVSTNRRASARSSSLYQTVRLGYFSRKWARKASRIAPSTIPVCERIESSLFAALEMPLS